MEAPSSQLLDAILRECAGAAPKAIYASVFVQSSGVDRATLDQALDFLRLKGFIRLTDWTQGIGQGYTLTDVGRKVWQSIAAEDASGKGIRAGAPPIRYSVQVHAGSPSAEPLDERPTKFTTWNRGEAVRESLLAPPRPIVTMTLIASCVLVFIAGGVLGVQRNISPLDYLFRSDGEARRLSELYFDMGDVNRFSVFVNHEWWRLLTYCFIHLGIMHLLLNMYFLFSLGPRLESMWGHGRFLFLYMFSGIMGGVFALLTPAPTAGASGALCGLLASMVFWVWYNRSHLGPDFTQLMLRNVFVNIALIAFISFIPGVSGACHLGGGLTGLILSVPLAYHRFGAPWQRWLALTAMILMVLAVVVLCVELPDVIRMREAWRH